MRVMILAAALSVATVSAYAAAAPPAAPQPTPSITLSGDEVDKIVIELANPAFFLRGKGGAIVPLIDPGVRAVLVTLQTKIGAAQKASSK